MLFASVAHVRCTNVFFEGGARLRKACVSQAEAVLEEIGLKPRAALELFYKQIIKRRAIPFPVQADSPEDDILSPATRRNQLADEF